MPGQYYARLCQRFIGAITAPTGEGIPPEAGHGAHSKVRPIPSRGEKTSDATYFFFRLLANAMPRLALDVCEPAQ